MFPPFYLFLGYPNVPIDASIRSENNKLYPLVIFKCSADNLSRDEHLRVQMNDEGWVPVRVIAGFRRVSGFPSSLKHICLHQVIIYTEADMLKSHYDAYCRKYMLFYNGVAYNCCVFLFA